MRRVFRWLLEKGPHNVPTEHVVIYKHSRCYLDSLVQISWLNRTVLQKHDFLRN